MRRYATHVEPGASPTHKQWCKLMRDPGREAFEAFRSQYEAFEAFRSQYSRGDLRGMGWTQRFEDFFGFNMETMRLWNCAVSG